MPQCPQSLRQRLHLAPRPLRHHLQATVLHRSSALLFHSQPLPLLLLLKTSPVLPHGQASHWPRSSSFTSRRSKSHHRPRGSPGIRGLARKWRSRRIGLLRLLSHHLLRLPLETATFERAKRTRRSESSAKPSRGTQARSTPPTAQLSLALRGRSQLCKSALLLSCVDPARRMARQGEPRPPPAETAIPRQVQKPLLVLKGWDRRRLLFTVSLPATLGRRHCFQAQVGPQRHKLHLEPSVRPNSRSATLASFRRLDKLAEPNILVLRSSGQRGKMWLKT